MIDDYIIVDGEINAISLVQIPAIARYFTIFKPSKQIVAPVIIPDMRIYRNENIDGVKKEFNVIWTKEGIESVLKKFFKKGGNIFTLYHDNDQVVDNAIGLYGLYCINSRLGILPPRGLDIPDGSVMANVEVYDNRLLRRIENGEFNGFSVEGNFDIIKI